MDAIDFHSKTSEKFDQYYSQSSPFRERFQVWSKLIDRYLVKDGSVLDAGCGSGVMSFYAAQKGNPVLAIDGSEEMIELCRKKSLSNPHLQLEFRVGKLPFRDLLNDDRFDMIISSSVLEYISEYESCLDEFSAHLNPGGIAVISLPNRESLYRKFEKLVYAIFRRPSYYAFVKNLFSLEEFNRKMKERGFEIVESQFYASSPILNNLSSIFSLPESRSRNLFVGVYKKMISTN
jgi:2-polyprenyl-6-hydroxyphenyl methylase/3-demethylubiquinone-9 3-methyltransferase